MIRQKDLTRQLNWEFLGCTGIFCEKNTVIIVINQDTSVALDDMMSVWRPHSADSPVFSFKEFCLLDTELLFFIDTFF